MDKPTAKKTKDGLSDLITAVNHVKANTFELSNEIIELLASHNEPKKIEDGYLLVKKKSMDHLMDEIRRIGSDLAVLLRQLQSELKSTLFQKSYIEKESATHKAMSEQQSNDLKHWKSRDKMHVRDLQTQKQESVELRNEITDLSSVTMQQSEYCNFLGKTTCTMLWRVTQREENVQSLFGSQGGSDFFIIACDTLDSYVSSITNHEISLQEVDQEMHFIRSFCGVLTNIAASAYGREEIVNNVNGKRLVDVVIILTCCMSGNYKPVMKLKNLLLMFLYNISINQKGVHYLSMKSELYDLLVTTIEHDHSVDNRLHAIRLAESLVLEPDNVEGVHKLLELFPVERMVEVANKSHGEVQAHLTELLQDVQVAKGGMGYAF